MQKIVPCLWFDHNAREAVEFYTSVFPDGKIISTSYYPNEGLADFQKEYTGKELTIEFELMGVKYTALNAGSEFKFTEAVSMQVLCSDQNEIDYYWEKLTADGGEESVCGWCKDKFGLSWQVVPENSGELIGTPAAFEKMMTMKKIVIQDLKDVQSAE